MMENYIYRVNTLVYRELKREMITINHCQSCDSDFMIPEEFFDGLDKTMFVCPECHSPRWQKLSDLSVLFKK